MALGTLPNTWTLPVEPARGASQHLVRVDVTRLELGLFVAELDRPWMDTPFLIQGFLVDSAIELTTLQRYCRYVFVDPAKSTPEAAHSLRQSAASEAIDPPESSASAFPAARKTPEYPAPAPTRTPAPPGLASPETESGTPSLAPSIPADNAKTEQLDAAARHKAASARSYRIRADVRITRETRDRFRKLVRGERAPAAHVEADSIGRRLIGRLRSLVGGAEDAPDTLPMIDAALDEELSALGSDSRVPDVRAVSADGLASALRDAQDVVAYLGEALADATRDVRAQRRVPLEPIAGAVKRLVENVLKDPHALLWVAQSDDEDHAQAIRASALIVAFGRQLRLPGRHLHALGTIGLLSDIGKCLLPRALLEKPGMLNAAEYSIVKEHVRLGLEALGRGNALDPLIAAGIAQHHERLDGSGYPKGLGQDEIGLHGRMAAIVDSFSALCAPRTYANALAPQDALMSLFQWSESSFDTALVEQFVRAIGVFPVGTLVELSTGEIAAVLAQDPARRLSPRVLAITHPDKRPREAPLEVPIGQDNGDSSAAPTRVVRGLPAGAYGLSCPSSHPDEALDDAPPEHDD